MSQMRLSGYCKTAYPAFSEMETLEIDGELKERKSGLARYVGELDWNGVRLYVKVYTGDSKAALTLRRHDTAVLGAARAIYRIASPSSEEPASVIERALSNGVAPPVAICHSTLYLDGSRDPWSVVVVAPYVDGVRVYNLAKRAGGRLSISEVKKLYCSFIEAASLIESAQVIHGDLNPGNIIYMDHDGNYKAVIVDFDGAITKESIRKNNIKPFFVFNLDQSNVALTPGVDPLDDGNIFYIDYIESIYVGLEFLLRSERSDVVEQTDFSKPIDVGHELSELLGRRYVEHVNRVIKGDFSDLGGSPIARIRDDMNGDGVCP